MPYTQEELDEIFYKEFVSENATWLEVSEKMNHFKHPEINELRKKFCNFVLSEITDDYTEYSKNFRDSFGELTETLLEHIEKLPEEYWYYHAFYHFLKGNLKKCMSILKNYIKDYYDEAEEYISSLEENPEYPHILNWEFYVVDDFLVPYKNAYPGFWKELSAEIKKYPFPDEIKAFFDMIDEYYSAEKEEEKVDVLLDFIQKFPVFISPKELLALSYFRLKKWNNAIAYFEQVEDVHMCFTPAFIYWELAWAYSGCKRYRKEEEYYRKVMEISPDEQYLYNNLAYCLYRQKRYQEAKEYLEVCIEKKIDMPYAANNYVRVLIALGRNKDAKTFIKKSGFKINKTLVNRAMSLPDTNARLKKVVPDVSADIDDDAFEALPQVLNESKAQQFSSEKILEDELTARIESGIPVFGKNLKIYKRKGEYGRQYIIPIGRLDLLCEDDAGNLYIIELKKDHGYSDAYKQTAEYLDWFEKNKIAKGKKVYGIICLNDPAQELIDNVHADKRMRLFEYQIMYTER